MRSTTSRDGLFAEVLQLIFEQTKAIKKRGKTKSGFPSDEYSRRAKRIEELVAQMNGEWVRAHGNGPSNSAKPD